MVEPVRKTTRKQSLNYIREAGYNTFLLRSRDVYIDLLTDSGTSAMSDRQWAGMMMGDEAYAGSENFYQLEETVRLYYGYKYMEPTHQGRAAEHIISKLLICQGDIIPGNIYFTTTKLHHELAGGAFEDVIIEKAHDPEVFDKARNMVVVYEGLHTYGGMAGRDMEALSIGISESVNEVYTGRQDVNGLRFVYEPEYLRFFQSRFEPME